MTRKAIKGKYISSQLYSNIPLCKENHIYGNLDLLGPMCIAGKTCIKCSHIIYKDEVVKRRNDLIETISKIKKHIDLFQF